MIQSKPREENRALEHLKRRGFACYLPNLRAAMLRSGRRFEAHERVVLLLTLLQQDQELAFPVRSIQKLA